LPLLLMPLLKVFMLVFVWAALAGKSQDQDALRKDLRGAFTMDCEIAEPSDYVLSKEGQEAENKLWVSATVPYVKTAIIMLTNTIRTRRWKSSTRQTLAREVLLQSISTHDH
jgi:hypothetical protein